MFTLEPASIAFWLHALSAARLVVLNPRLVLETETLLRKLQADENKGDPAAYAYALASLLAKDETRWKQIIDHFQNYFGCSFPLPGAPPPSSFPAILPPPPPGFSSSPANLEPSPWAGYRPSRLLQSWTRLRLLSENIPAKAWALIALVALIPLIWALPISINKLGEQIQAQAPAPSASASVDMGAVEIGPPDAGSPDAGPFDAGPPVENAEATLERIQSEERIPIPGDDHPPPSPLWLYIALASCSAILAILGARLFFADSFLAEDRKKIADRAQVLRNQALERVWESGQLYHIEQVPPLPHAALDDAATLLGRVTRLEEGLELDIPATLRRTVQAAGRIIPVHAPGRRPQPILIWVDIETGDHPYLAAVEMILERWKKLGVPFVRYDYADRPASLLSHPDRRSVSLEALARRGEDAPLLLISRMHSPQDYRGKLDWLRSLDAWTARAWLDVDPRERDERSPTAQRMMDRLQKRLPRYPLTREGLLACATALSSRESKRKAPPRASILPWDEGIEEALKLWAAVSCCVPDPVWAQLDSLRRELPELYQKLPEPRYLQRLIDWVKRENIGEGEVGVRDKLYIREDEKRRLVAWLRVWDEKRFPGLPMEARVEGRTRKLLIRQLEAAKVGGDEFAKQLRDMKKRLHEAVLEPAKAKAFVEECLKSAVAVEMARAIADELAQQELAGEAGKRGKWSRRVRETVAGVMEGRAGVHLGDGWKLWRWNRRQAVGVVGVLGVLLLGFGMHWRLGIAPEERMLVMPAEHKLKGTKAAAEAPAETRSDVALAGVAPMRFKRLPGGKFRMGSPETEKDRSSDEKQHWAEVGSFEIGVYEVTLKQWEAVMKTRPNSKDWGDKDEHPVNNVSWEDAIRFMNALTDRENTSLPEGKKLSRCYDEQKWRWDRKCTGYRLPTEAEWEYAARAGTETAYSFGEDAKDLCRYGNGDSSACDDGHSKLAPVGSYISNGWGLFDMHGNVWEWVWDKYGEYPERSGLGYAGVDDKGNNNDKPTDNNNDKLDDSVSRVLRGGSFVIGPGWLRSSVRDWLRPTLRSGGIGFRCVRGSLPPASGD